MATNIAHATNASSAIKAHYRVKTLKKFGLQKGKIIYKIAKKICFTLNLAMPKQ